MKIFERRKLSLFITSLLIAILAWVFFALSNRYSYQASTQIHYINSPSEKAFHSLQSDTVSLQIEGTGWQTLFSKLKISPQSIEIDLKNLNTKNYIAFSEQLKEINDRLASDQRIISVHPDTLYFDFSARSAKKVPVKLAYNLQFENRYSISGPPKITPAFVMVMGPAKDLANLTYWLTDSLKMSSLKSDFATRVFLKRSPKNNISIYPNAVNVKIPVDEFTEKIVEIPLRPVNTKGYEVRLLPEKVKITFLTALKNYHNNDDAIEATIDLAKWQSGEYKQLPVNISHFPGYCKFISVDPQIVDFIIQ